jgi:hypothetical protein
MTRTLVVLAAFGCAVSCSDGSPGTNGDGGNDPDGTMSMSDGGGTTDGTNPGMDTGPETCLGSNLLAALGKTHLLAGAAMSDNTAKAAPFDLRYLYLSGGLFDGNTPCASCATNCTSSGTSCKNGSNCAWWGCWQYDQDPPGAYARTFITTAGSNGQIPMITYYMILQASKVQEGAAEVTQAANDTALMTRYFADWRFLLQQIGMKTALLHIEPDFWGYAQQVGTDPHKEAAAIASANPTDCGSQENSIAGMGKCMIAMVRKYAPNAKVGLHASAWSAGPDVAMNTDPKLDVAGYAAKTANFLVAAGAADGDYIVVEASDRDAGYYQSMGRMAWWDDTNTKLPTFHQAFAWAKAVAETANRPLIWWQLPVGNMTLGNVNNAWKDNRVDYFFAHTQELADAHSVAFAFGAGAGGQTTPESDGGNLIAKVKAYGAAPQSLCK